MTKEKANRNEVVGMFLTYCRKTLVNARTDVLRERKRRRNREVLFCDLRRSELESLADWQDVPERETVFDAAGKPIRTCGLPFAPPSLHEVQTQTDTGRY